jgi:GTPase SAR1 family protein
MHFCPGLPIILVGCKIDLRHDPKIIEELNKAGQQPTTPKEVCLYSTLLNDPAFIVEFIDCC